MKYVSDKAASWARELSQRFRDLPEGAGILFISVRAVPVEDGNSKAIDICLGMEQHLDHKLGISIVQKVLEKELNEQRIILRTVDVFSGIPGAACSRPLAS